MRMRRHEYGKCILKAVKYEYYGGLADFSGYHTKIYFEKGAEMDTLSALGAGGGQIGMSRFLGKYIQHDSQQRNYTP